MGILRLKPFKTLRSREQEQKKEINIIIMVIIAKKKRFVNNKNLSYNFMHSLSF